MARTVREASLATRSARLRLAVASKPYWRVIEQGLHPMSYTISFYSWRIHFCGQQKAKSTLSLIVTSRLLIILNA